MKIRALIFILLFLGLAGTTAYYSFAREKTVSFAVNGKIKDISFTLNTLQENRASFITDVINGELECVIISSTTPVQIKITLDVYEDVVLLDVVNYSGEKYIPLRAYAIDKNLQMFNLSQEKWVLNNKLKVEVKGMNNIEVNFVVRYK